MADPAHQKIGGAAPGETHRDCLIPTAAVHGAAAVPPCEFTGDTAVEIG